VSGTGASLLALKDGLPGFGLFLTRKGRMVYAVEYVKDGRLITKVIGTVNKVSLKKARKRAAKLLSENQITAKPAEPQITAKPTPSQTTDANRKSESSIAKDRTRSRQTKAEDEPSPTAKVPRKLVTFDELMETYSILYSRRQIDRLEAAGKFPKRVLIGERRVAWVASEIDTYVEQQIAKRSTGIGTLGSGRKPT
jgi:prophage regulatory protein